MSRTTPEPPSAHDASLAPLLTSAPFMILFTDEQGSATYFNEAWVRFTGIAAAEQLGRRWMSGFHPHDASRNETDFELGLGSRERFRFDFRIRRNDNGFHDIYCRMEPHYDTSGLFSGFVGYVIDITELNDARESERLARARLELALAGTNEGIWDRPDLNSDAEYWSPRLYALLGYQDGEIPGSRSQLRGMIHPDDLPELTRRVQSAVEQNLLYDFEYRIRTQDGNYRWFHSRAIIVRDDDGTPQRMTGSLADIHARKVAERALLEEKEKAEVTLASLAEGVISIDGDGRIEYANDAAVRLAADIDADWRGRSIDAVLSFLDDDGKALNLSAICRATEQRAQKNIEAHFRARPGRRTVVEIAVAPITTADEGRVGSVVVLRDVTEARRLTRRMAHQATHDPLTNLVNRREFERRLARTLKTAAADTSEHAVCYIDLDQFKIINDSCGHRAGDELLKQVARLFRGALRKRDTVCRLGGDEFGLLMEHCAIEHALSSADMLRQRTEAYRFSWEGRTFAIGASIGVVMVNADSDDLAGVLQRADAACYAAKEQGRNRVHVYRENDVDLARMRSEMRWVSRINYAIDSNGFELYFQPVHAAVGNDIPYYEFLLRLHEEGVVILPGHFLPAAERYNLSVKIDRWVVAEALRLLCNEVLPGGIEAVWAINLSGASLGDEAFADWVLERIEDSGIAGQRLCFEVTETAAITNFSRALDFFARLQKRGCHLALDDFGSGLSSFAYLKTLPVDYVKIDGMFVRDLETDLIARSIVKAIVDIGHLLGTTTIAEFVESAGAADALLEIGADYLQGFHVARPRPV